MKKIVSIMLLLACALTCSFALASCGDPVEPAPETPVVVYSEAVAPFVNAVKATAANTVDATVKVDVQGETLTAAYHTVKNSDGTKTMTYAVEVLNGVDVADNKSVVEGTATSDASGVFTDEYAKVFGANGVALNLSAFGGTDFDISANVLRITVAAADTAAVLGTAIGADAVVVVTINNGAVISVTVNYATPANTVEIVCEYNKPVEA